MVALTFTPISWAAPRSSLTASMAWPGTVLLTNSVSAAMMMTQAMMVTMVSAEMTSCPSNRASGSRPAAVTMEVKLLGSDFHSSCATCCSR